LTILAIAEAILSEVRNDDAATTHLLNDVLLRANTLVELYYLAIKRECPGSADTLEAVVDEVFVDLNVSLTLAAAKKFKASLVLARVCLESSINVLFFMDHPVELRQWATAGNDRSFTDTIEQISSASYLEAAAPGVTINHDNLSDLRTSLKDAYRLLSERVHGKYRFLEVNQDDATRLSSFGAVMTDALSALKSLILTRLRHDPYYLEQIPALVRA
jgi:hypothetical protein